MFSKKWNMDSRLDNYLTISPYNHILISNFSDWMIYHRNHGWNRKLMVICIGDYKFKKNLMKIIDRAVEKKQIDNVIEKYKDNPIRIDIENSKVIDCFFVGGIDV